MTLIIIIMSQIRGLLVWVQYRDRNLSSNYQHSTIQNNIHLSPVTCISLTLIHYTEVRDHELSPDLNK